MKLFLFILVVILALSTQANPEAWKVITTGESVWFYKNGNGVHGHKLGFVNKKGECDTNYLLISWSSYEDMKQFEGVMIPMTISNEKGELIKIRPPLTTVRKYAIFYVGYFNGRAVTDDFINFIEQSKEVTITLTQKKQLKEGFDVFKETFDISKSDFIKAKKDALSRCLDNKV